MKKTSTHKLGDGGTDPSGNDEARPVIVAVDDDKNILKLLDKMLSGSGYCVIMFSDPEEVAAFIRGNRCDIIFADVNMPGMSGTELLRKSKKINPYIEVIIITGAPDIKDAVSAVKEGAFDYLSKPFDLNTVLNTVKRALEHQAEASDKPFDAARKEEDRTPGDYKVLRTIGGGNMGVVLLVEKDRHQYAMKILRREPDNREHDIRVKRFFREAAVLAQIDHPGIVKIYEFGMPKDKDVPYMLMEYVKGHSLDHYLKSDSLDVDLSLSVIREVADALSVIHKHRIIHRDIKPSNILITDDFSVKVSDFGVARISDSSLTLATGVMGTPVYMAPECFDREFEIDARADIFSLGALGYEMLTGIRPFSGRSMVEVIEALREAKPIEPRKLAPEIPPWIQDMLGKMLAKNPASRFQKAEELVKTIDRCRKKPDKAESSRLPGKISRYLRLEPEIWN